MLGRNLNPRAFPCLHEKPGADQTFDDASSGVGGDMKRVLDVTDRQHRNAVVDDLLDD